MVGLGIGFSTIGNMGMALFGDGVPTQMKLFNVFTVGFSSTYQWKIPSDNRPEQSTTGTV